MLEVAHGHRIHWEAAGNPDGIPLLFLHGGPGSAVGRGHLRQFDPTQFNVITVQQRGAGRSVPSAASDEHRLEDNTTALLVDDLVALRTELGITSWLVCGVSWGSTLALTYALADRAAVAGILLLAVTTTSTQEVEWITEGVGIVYPEAWDRLASTLERLGPWRRGSGERLVDGLAAVMAGHDLDARRQMAEAWMDWEDTHIQVGLPVDQLRRGGHADWPIDDKVAFTTLVAHYWSHHARQDAGWVPTGGLVGHLKELEGIPLCMIHGRRDVSGPVSTPWAVKGELPDAQLHIVETEGHGGPMMMRLMAVAALSFARYGDFSGFGDAD